MLESIAGTNLQELKERIGPVKLKEYICLIGLTGGNLTERNGIPWCKILLCRS